MHKFIKFLIIIVIIFLVLSYYKIFSFNYGFSSNLNNIDIDALIIKEVKILSLGDSTFFIAVKTISKQYIGIVDDATVAVITTVSIFNGSQTTQLSFLPLIIGFIAILVVIFIPKKKIAIAEEDNSEITDDTKFSKKTIIITTTIIIIIILFTLIGIVYNLNSNSYNQNNTVVTDNTLKSNDFEFKRLPDEITVVSIYYEITPKVDIEYIKYKIYIYDSDGSIINEATETKYDLDKNQSYKYRVEVGFVNYLKTANVKLVLLDGKKKK